MDIHSYPDDQMRQELVDFYNWKPEAVLSLSSSEILAWKKHAIALRNVGFWFTRGSLLPHGVRKSTGTGWA